MKNLRNKTRTAFFLLVITGLLMPCHILAQNTGLLGCQVTANGTGKTTGDIVAMTIYNPSDKEVKGSLGPYFIGGEGKYQDYIVPSVKHVTVPAGQTIRIILEGYCTDITKKPAGEKDNFKLITSWIKVDTPSSRSTIPMVPVPNPDTHPEQAAPSLLGALHEISKAYDKLKNEGRITTPFSGNPEKEREAIIQQTFWIYTSNLRQKPYTKEQFSNRTYEQYEEKTNIKPITLPPDKKQQLNKGIDDFWNTFQAVGTEAKILNIPSKPEDENMIKTISGPVQTTCACGECRLIEGQRIHIYLSQYGEPFAGDSIPWSTNQVFISQPDVLSTCVPMECLPTKTFEMRTTITYKDKQFASPPATWKKYEFTVASPVMEHQGEMLFEFRFKCYCAGKFCAEGMTSRKVYFIEKNTCCDSIRAKNNGQLSFSFKGGSAKINGNTLSFNLPGCDVTPFVFNFNLEAIFCNLSDDEVFSQLISIMQSKTSGGTTTEFHSSSDLSMGGPSTDPNMGRFYGFGFSKNENGKEVAVFISVDKEKCIFDISVLCNDKMFEITAPPYLSQQQLIGMTNALGQPTNGQTWTNSMLILSHLARANAHDKSAGYMSAFHTYLGRVSSQAGNLMSNTTNPQLKAQLQALKDAIKECITKNDFNLLGNVLAKMIPVANAMNQ